jgi:CheY-like chemotaxis protein
LLDLMMPVMNGWALIDVLKRDDALSSIPVVVFSAHRHPTHVTPLDTPKAVLSKPLSMAQLIRTVERWAA